MDDALKKQDVTVASDKQVFELARQMCNR